MNNQPGTPSLGQRAFDLFKGPFRYARDGHYIYDFNNEVVVDVRYTKLDRSLVDPLGRQLADALTTYWKFRKFGPLKNPQRYSHTTHAVRASVDGNWVKWEDHKAAIAAVMALPPLDWDAPPEVVPDDAYAQTLNFGGDAHSPASEVDEVRATPKQPDTATPLLMERMREIAYRDSAKAVTVRADDLRALLTVADQRSALVDECNRLIEKLRTTESVAMAYRTQDLADKAALRDSFRHLLELTTITGKAALQMLDNPGEPNAELCELLKLDSKPVEHTITFTQESLAAALAEVRCLHDISVELIAEDVFLNHFGGSPK